MANPNEKKFVPERFTHTAFINTKSPKLSYLNEGVRSFNSRGNNHIKKKIKENIENQLFLRRFDSKAEFRPASYEEEIVENFLSQENLDLFDTNSPKKLQSFTDKSLPKYRKSASIVKIEVKSIDKELVLTDMEMLRLMDARNADIGKSSVLHQPSMTSERLASLIYLSTTEGSAGPT